LDQQGGCGSQDQSEPDTSTEIVGAENHPLYHTVSDEASTVPADLFGLERARLWYRLLADITSGETRPSKQTVKREERSRTVEEWLQRWEATRKASRI
jgi:hypothetical protein